MIEKADQFRINFKSTITLRDSDLSLFQTHLVNLVNPV